MEEVRNLEFMMIYGSIMKFDADIFHGFLSY